MTYRSKRVQEILERINAAIAKKGISDSRADFRKKSGKSANTQNMQTG